MKILAVVLIALGILALVYQGFTYTTREQDAKLGPVVISHDQNHSVWVPPVIGGLLIVAGVGTLVASGRSRF